MAQGILDPEIAPEDRPLVVKDYVERGERLRTNFDLMVDEGAFDKASECLWGWFSNFTNAIAILRTGNRIRAHAITEEFAESLAFEFQDPIAAKAIPDARNMHRNFYHGGPRDKSEFVDPLEHISRFIELADATIRRELAPDAVRGSSLPRSRGRRRR